MVDREPVVVIGAHGGGIGVDLGPGAVQQAQAAGIRPDGDMDPGVQPGEEDLAGAYPAAGLDPASSREAEAVWLHVPGGCAPGTPVEAGQGEAA